VNLSFFFSTYSSDTKGGNLWQLAGGKVSETRCYGKSVRVPFKLGLHFLCQAQHLAEMDKRR